MRWFLLSTFLIKVIHSLRIVALDWIDLHCSSFAWFLRTFWLTESVVYSNKHCKAPLSFENERLINSCIMIMIMIMIIIVSITNFSIMIGSPRAYLSGNRRVITCVSNYRCSIWTFVIVYLRDFHVNYARFNVFLRDVFYSFQNLLKAPLMFSLKRNSQKTFLFRNLL